MSVCVLHAASGLWLLLVLDLLYLRVNILGIRRCAGAPRQVAAKP